MSSINAANRITLKDLIKSEARRLGFQLFGVTTPKPPLHLEVYEGWLEAGHQAGMGWMGTERNRQRRADPKLILPECQSILVLGIAYPPSYPVQLSLGEGSAASYARGDDYHYVLPDRLKTIVEFIEKQVGHTIPNRWYTDTGPILERELAQRAGLGWIGKNTCLINPDSGSYFLLAEILMEIKLPPDEAITSDHCGSCTRCIEACPTSCILPNRTIDANRCLSYLTIEEKGPIPLDLRPQIGNWVFGCDVCQQVCPWNLRFAASSSEERFAVKPERAQTILKDELALTPQEFNRKFKGSPIQRTKRRGYLRNVAIALGNIGDADSVPALIQALSDSEPLVRGHAAWALGQIGESSAQKRLEETQRIETDLFVLEEIRASLTQLQNNS